MSIPHLYWTAFALLFNDEGNILLHQRQNTWYYDGWRTLVAWHIESGETAHQTMVREVAEETWLEITMSDITPHHVLHRLSDDREYIDISFIVHDRSGTPTIIEPDTCTALERFDLETLPKYMPPENFILLEAYLADNKWFSEIDLRTT